VLPSIAGCVPLDWEDKCADDEHCGSDQGLDADLFFILSLWRTCYGSQPAGLCLLLLWGRRVLRASDDELKSTDGRALHVKCEMLWMTGVQSFIAPVALQVAVYNYMKLQMIRQKAAQSSGKDMEKMGGQEQPLLSGNDAPIKIAADTGHKNGLTFASFRSALRPAHHYCTNRCAGDFWRDSWGALLLFCMHANFPGVCCAGQRRRSWRRSNSYKMR
jgi:hypothetical protein